MKEPLALGLLEDQDYYCYYHCLIFSPSIPPPIFLNSSASPFIFPVRFFFSLSHVYFSPTFPLLHCLSLSFPLYSGPQSEDKLLAGRCCRGGRASESLMRCLSPQSRPDRSSQQRITTTTTTIAHRTVLHTVPCLPATAAAEGVARGKVCLCVEREESEAEGCVSRRCVEAIYEGTAMVVCVYVSEGYTGRAAFCEEGVCICLVYISCTDISEWQCVLLSVLSL